MAWAYANDVNLLAANSGFPKVGSTGSGIYAGRDGLVTAVNHEVPVREIYVAAVPKKINGKRQKPVVIKPRGIKTTDSMFIIIDNSMGNFTTKVLNSTDSKSQEHQVCSKEFCCDFNVTKQAKILAEKERAYEFRVGVFNGYRSFQGIAQTYLRTCGIFACTNSSITSCGATFKDSEGIPVSDFFENIEIKAKYPKIEKMLIQPTGVHRDLIPIPVEEFDFDVKPSGNFYEVSLKTTKRTDLLGFGIFTNYYENSAGAAMTSFLLLIGSFLLSRLL